MDYPLAACHCKRINYTEITKYSPLTFANKRYQCVIIILADYPPPPPHLHSYVTEYVPQNLVLAESDVDSGASLSHGGTKESWDELFPPDAGLTAIYGEGEITTTLN